MSCFQGSETYESDTSDEDVAFVKRTGPKKAKISRDFGGNAYEEIDSDDLISDDNDELRFKTKAANEFSNLSFKNRNRNDPNAPKIKETLHLEIASPSQVIKYSINELKKKIENLQDSLSSEDSPRASYLNKSSSSSNSSSDDEDDVKAVQTKKKHISIYHQPTKNTWKLIWKKDETFREVLSRIPEQFRKCQILFNGIKWRAGEVLFESVHDNDNLFLVDEKKQDEMIKLRIMLSEDNIKKVKVSKSNTWRYIIDKLGVGKKLFFDGNELPLDQKIGSNDEVVDEDQIDLE